MKRITLLALVIGLSALTTFAQDGPRGPGGQRGPGGPRGGGRLAIPVIATLDVNTNRVIEASEIANASAALLKLDKSGDGKLDATELKPQMPGGNGQPFTPPDGGKLPTLPVMKALDANGDGELDASEIANASTALKTLDTNGDGQLTMDELMPRPSGGFGGRDGGERQENK